MEASNTKFSTLLRNKLSHESENMNFESMINSNTKKEPQEESAFLITNIVTNVVLYSYHSEWLFSFNWR